MTTTSIPARRDGPVVAGAVIVSLLAAAVNIAGAFLGVDWMSHARWLYVAPLVVALAGTGTLRDRRGWWWLAGLVLSGVGDTQGGRGFLVLLGAFLLAHLCFIVALWPARRQSWVGRRPALLHAVILGLALTVLVPAVDGVLVAPVIAYASVLAFMAVLATAGGPVGIVGGLLFMISDLVLGVGMFAVDLPDAVQTLVVIGTYVPAQVLLFLTLRRLVAGAGGGLGRGS